MGGMPSAEELAKLEGLEAASGMADDDLMSDSGAQVAEIQRSAVKTSPAKASSDDDTPQKSS